MEKYRNEKGEVGILYGTNRRFAVLYARNPKTGKYGRAGYSKYMTDPVLVGLVDSCNKSQSEKERKQLAKEWDSYIRKTYPEIPEKLTEWCDVFPEIWEVTIAFLPEGKQYLIVGCEDECHDQCWEELYVDDFAIA